MAYTKARFIEQVFLKINGGELNDESSVQREDIESYLPAAVNYAMMASRNIILQQDGHRDVASCFYGFFGSLPILKDTARHNWSYVAWPKGYVPLPSNEGIRMVEDGDGNMLKPLSDNGFKTINHTLEIFTGAKYYRPEKKGLYLFGINPLTDTLSGLTIIVDVDDLDDDDILPIQAGMEKTALDLCYEYTIGERQLPADKNIDKRDVN